jgi:hypothetical protein
MKSKIIILFLLPMMAIAQLTSPIPYPQIDISTLTTNATYSVGMLTVTNQFTNQGFLSQRSNTISVGDSFPIAFGKVNTFMYQVDEWATTNNFGTNGGGGGGGNYVANNNGYGTNEYFSAVTILADNNVFIYSLATNCIPSMSGSTTPFGTCTSSVPYPLHNQWDAFTQGVSTWESYNSTGTNIIYYAFPTPVTIGGFIGTINSSSLSTTLILQESSDGVTWYNAFSPVTQVFTGGTTTESISTVTAQYWRWTIYTSSAGPSGWLSASDFQLIQTASTPQKFVSSMYYNNGSGDVGDGDLIFNTDQGVGINMNYSGGYALNVNGSINITGQYYSNGIPFSGGVGSGNYIQNLYGLGTNATLYGSNSISGISFYTEMGYTNAATNYLFIISSGTNYGLNGQYTWYNLLQGLANTNIFVNTNDFNAIQGRANPYVYGEIIPTTNYPGAANKFTWFLSVSYTNIVQNGYAYYTNISVNPAGTYTVDANNDYGSWPSSVFATYGTDPSSTNQFTHSVLSMNGAGPYGSVIIWPSGDQIYEQSFYNVQATNDSGIYIGKGNGQMLGESFSTVLGASNDVEGSAAHQLSGGSVLGGMGNSVGDTLGHGNYATTVGGWSNSVYSDYSVAVGSACLITNIGVLMWNDSTNLASSKTTNEVIFHAANGFHVTGGGFVDAAGFSENGISGATTNISIGGHTFYITNGLIMIVQ